MRSAASCASYHYCKHDRVTHSDRCAAGLAFDARLQACDLAARVDCLACSAHGVLAVRDPDDCRRYYACVEGERRHQQCAAGLAFSAELGECDVAERVRCERPLNVVCARFRHMRHVQLGVPDDCTRYVVCVRGRGWERRCPLETYFDATRGKCALPGAVNFCQTSGPFVQQSNAEADKLAFEPPLWNQQEELGQRPPQWQPQPNDGGGWQPQPQPPSSSQPKPPPTQNQPPPPSHNQPPSADVVVIHPRPPLNETADAAASETRCVPLRAGYNVLPGTGCQRYVYCIRGVVRFEYTCPDDGGRSWFDTLTSKCERTPPAGC